MRPESNSCTPLLDGLRTRTLTNTKHPLHKEKWHLREAYFTGVAFLLTRVAEQVTPAGSSYLQELVQLLRLGPIQATRLTTLARSADAGIIERIAGAFAAQRHKYLFVIELYQATRVSGSWLRPAEQRMIEIFAEELRLAPAEISFLKRFAVGLHARNPKQLLAALSDAFQLCQEPPLEVFQYFCGHSLPGSTRPGTTKLFRHPQRPPLSFPSV